MTTSFSELYKHPEWQKKRLEMLERAGWICESCEDKEKTLHVHHRFYRRGKKPWEYEDSVFVVLCEDCHKEQHRTKNDWDSVYRCIERNLGGDGLDSAIAILIVWFSLEHQEFQIEGNAPGMVSRGLGDRQSARLREFVDKWWEDYA